MDTNAQNAFLSKWYAEANRYMDNAKDALKKAGVKDNGYYKYGKYVRTACGIANIGVMVALDAWLKVNGVPEPAKKREKTIFFYESNVEKIDESLAMRLNTASNVFDVGYYNDLTMVKVIEGGFDAAYEIIEKIKPEQLVEVKETKGQGLKRALNNLLISAAVMFR